MTIQFEMIRMLPRLIIYVLCFPYIIYLGWKKEDAFNNGNWNTLVDSLKRIQKFGGLSPRDLFLLGHAHCNLNRIDEALRFFEIIQAPLEDIDEEACRYCSHAWALFKIGETEQSKAILAHAVSENWPSYRKEWVSEFINSIKRKELFDANVMRPTLSIH